jgi:hypothetical protein
MVPQLYDASKKQGMLLEKEGGIALRSCEWFLYSCVIFAG